MSLETRARQKVAQQREWNPETEKGKARLLKYKIINKGINNPMYGVRLTDETKEKHKIAAIRMWKDMSEGTKIERNRKISESKTGDKNPAKRADVRDKIKQTALKNPTRYWKDKKRSKTTLTQKFIFNF